jgi:hypothetical protein
MSAKYDVGFKKPPKHSKFKKGQSGNPKGRPKGSKSLKEVIDKAFWRLVQMKAGEIVSKVPALEASVNAIMAKAMHGDVKAFQCVVKLWDKAQELPSTSSTQHGGGDTASGFAWTEEHESLTPYLEHLLYGDKPITDAQA